MSSPEYEPTLAGQAAAPEPVALPPVATAPLIESADVRYAVGGEIARGGMGAILSAQETATGRTVAMKLMLREATADDRRRFVTEARVTAQLEHPNIVPVHELGTHPDGRTFYTMKLVRGITMRRILEGLVRGDRETVARYPLAQLLTVFQKVCDAVAFAHAKGVIHRDLKPENVMIGRFGEVLVMDWGLAKILAPLPESAEDAGDASVIARSAASFGTESVGSSGGSGTLAGSVIGTPHYMSPEQAAGEIVALDGRSDVYSLGAILYQILTLRRPVTGRSVAEILDKVRRGEIEPFDSQLCPPVAGATSTAEASPDPHPRSLAVRALPHLPGGGLPRSLAAVVRKAMALSRDHRYPGVPGLQKDLAAYQGGFATTAEHAGLMKQLHLLLLRHKKDAAILTASVLALVALGGVAYVRVKNERDAAEAHRQIAERERSRAEKTLADLRGTAPTFFEQAKTLTDQGKFEEALEKVRFAIDLTPERPEYLLLRAHLLQTQLRFPEAIDAFRAVLERTPQESDAQTNLALTEKLQAALAAQGAGGELPKESLRELYLALVAQQRTGEALSFAGRGLGRDDLLRGYQQQVGAAYGKAMKGAVTLHADGTADLNGYVSKIADLRPLRGIPFSSIDLRSAPVSDLSGLEGMPLRKLIIGNTKVSDLRPLRGAPLVYLDVSTAAVEDLSPLAGMPLEELNLASNSTLRDLTSLAGMPLRRLDLLATGVTDLSPLLGMPLEYLSLPNKLSDLKVVRTLPLKSLTVGATRVTDLSPLAGMALEKLGLGFTGVHDLSPLRGMPLRELICNHCWELHDLSPLADIPTLEHFDPPPDPAGFEVVRALPNLKSLWWPDLPNPPYRIPAAEFFTRYFSHPQLVEKARATLRERGLKLNTEGSRTIPGWSVRSEDGATLLISLSGCELYTLVSMDGLPVRELNIARNRLRDLTPLRGAPLVVLRCDDNPITDLAPLADCPDLEMATVPPEAKNVELLRKLPKLRHLSYRWDKEKNRPTQTVEEFWQEWDQKAVK